jgi:hypothetical protein
MPGQQEIEQLLTDVFGMRGVGVFSEFGFRLGHQYRDRFRDLIGSVSDRAIRGGELASWRRVSMGAFSVISGKGCRSRPLESRDDISAVARSHDARSGHLDTGTGSNHHLPS